MPHKKLKVVVLESWPVPKTSERLKLWPRGVLSSTRSRSVPNGESRSRRNTGLSP
ncbi:MAG: hypothetical protein AAF215_00575 [Cyanobacteria bacterium P01_A01_bin.123]